MALAVAAETQEPGLVRAVVLAEPVVDLAVEVGDIRAAVQEVAVQEVAVQEVAAEEAALAPEVGQGQVGERLVATAEPQNGFLPHRCYMARAQVEDRGLADLAVPAANMPLQKMTSAVPIAAERAAGAGAIHFAAGSRRTCRASSK